MAEAESNELGIRMFKRADNLRAARAAVFDPNWQDISQYFLPDLSDINTEKTESTTDWYQRIYDTAPIRAASTCSVGVRNWVTPSTEPWLDLSPPVYLTKNQQRRNANPRLARLGSPNAPEVDENGQDEATRWCSTAATQGLEDLSASNFYTVVQTFNKSAGVFGTALMFLEEGTTETFKFEQFKVGTFCIAENDQKIVDTVMRWFKLTLRQAVQKFCKQREDGSYELGNLPKKMREAYEKKKFDQSFNFIHHCMPMNDYKFMGGETDDELTRDMAVASVYQEVDSKMLIKRGGYEEMPYFCLRWARWGTENQVWGTSPAFETLPEARQINVVTQYNDALVEQKAFPRVLAPDSLDGEIQMAAGAATTVRADDMARGAVPKEWMTEGETAEVMAMIERKQKAIDEAFFKDVFNALGMLMDKKMTATEVTQRIGEKLDQFTGTFDQYVTELINPLVRRMLGILFRANKLPEPPQALMVQKSRDPRAPRELALPKIAIKNRVTLALAEVRNVGILKWLEVLEPLAEQRPEILDNVDLDQLVRVLGHAYNVPNSVIRSLKNMQELRDKRAKQMEEERQLQMAKMGAEAAGKLGKAPQPLQDAAVSQLQTAQAA